MSGTTIIDFYSARLFYIKPVLALNSGKIIVWDNEIKNSELFTRHEDVLIRQPRKYRHDPGNISGKILLI